MSSTCTPTQRVNAQLDLAVAGEQRVKMREMGKLLDRMLPRR